MLSWQGLSTRDALAKSYSTGVSIQAALGHPQLSQSSGEDICSSYCAAWAGGRWSEFDETLPILTDTAWLLRASVEVVVVAPASA